MAIIHPSPKGNIDKLYQPLNVFVHVSISYNRAFDLQQPLQNMVLIAMVTSNPRTVNDGSARE